ncbi:80 kD MCM3-associated protein, partial [Penicillium taxi]|uniref:80 kD MCM3-associated protein n=1 Tax=Penicillium taxi TaxID=168475 RepID=UPI002545119D
WLVSSTPLARLGAREAPRATATTHFVDEDPLREARNTFQEAGAQMHTDQETIPVAVEEGQGGSLSAATSSPAHQSTVSPSDNYQERYEQLKSERAAQRKKAIREGHMADPDQPTALNKAIRPVGTCTSMCPEFESIERIVQKMVDKKEKYLDPSTGVPQNSIAMMLKRFRRSAAGYEEQLPSDIRTPNTLLQTTNYLIRHIIGGEEPLGIIHKFVWDRTRSIRNDFSVQQVTSENDVKLAVVCLERIARFHIVSLHLLCSPDNEEPFDRHQEREQLNNTMLSLMYYYDDNRERIHFPCEDEFRAYYILFSIHDQRPDLEVRVQRWPASLLNSPRVQVALELYAASGNTWESSGTLDARRPNAIAQGFYSRFFNIIDSPSVSYLTACVAEIYFSQIRQTAIRSIWKGYRRLPVSQQAKNEDWTLDELTRVLHFDDDEQTIQFCEEQDLQLKENASGQLYLDWADRNVDTIPFSPSSTQCFSNTYVESKRVGRSLPAIILGMSIREAAAMGMIDPEEIRCGSEISMSPIMESFPLEAVPRADPSPSAFEPATLLKPSKQPAASTPFAGLSSPFASLRSSNQTAENTLSTLNGKATPLPASSSPFGPFKISEPSQQADNFSGSTEQTTSATSLHLSSSPFGSLKPTEPKEPMGVADSSAGQSIFPPSKLSFASSNPAAPDQTASAFPPSTGQSLFPPSKSPFTSFKPSQPIQEESTSTEKPTTSVLFPSSSSSPFTSFKPSEPIDPSVILPSTGIFTFPPSKSPFTSFKPPDLNQKDDSSSTISSPLSIPFQQPEPRQKADTPPASTGQAVAPHMSADSISSFISSEPDQEADDSPASDLIPPNNFETTAKSMTPNPFAASLSSFKPSEPIKEANAVAGSLFNRVTIPTTKQTPVPSPFLASSSTLASAKPSELNDKSGTLPTSAGQSLFPASSSSLSSKPSEPSQKFNTFPASTGQAGTPNPFEASISSFNRLEKINESHAPGGSIFAGTLPSSELAPTNPFPSSSPFTAFAKPSGQQQKAVTPPTLAKQAFSPTPFSPSASSASFRPMESNELAGSAAQSLSNRVMSPEQSATSTPFQTSTSSSASSFNASTFSRSHYRNYDDLYPAFETEEEERTAWQNLINSTVAKRARKRAREEEEQAEKRHEAYKLSEQALKQKEQKELQFPKLSKMVKVSDQAANAVKEAAVKAHKRMVDEDELLLTAARIVAEQLRTGPSIFEGYRRTR